jgi:hypothetical protein
MHADLGKELIQNLNSEDKLSKNMTLLGEAFMKYLWGINFFC